MVVDGSGSDETDAALLLRAHADPSAFGVFYGRHVNSVLAFHMRRTGCAQTAARRQLGTIARRQRVAARARRRMSIDPITRDSTDLERIETLVDFEPLTEALRAAVAELPPCKAEAVKLRIADDRTYAEVARALGCSEGAARVRVSRGLRTLAEIMGAQ